MPGWFSRGSKNRAGAEASMAETFNLGNQLAAQGRFKEAADCYRQVLAVNPGLAEVHCNLGNALCDQGRLEQGLDAYRRALELKPDFVAACVNLANALLRLGDFAQARIHYQRALALEPDLADAQLALGSILTHLGEREEAIKLYRRALRAKPDFVGALVNLANVLVDEGRPAEALEMGSRARALRPELPETHANVGRALAALGRHADADASFEKALSLNPNPVTAERVRFSRSLVKLLQGDYEAGWPLHESRFGEGGPAWAYKLLQQHVKQFPTARRWHGENPAGKTLVLWTDHGYGDSLMMLRYAKELKTRGASKVIVYCEPALVRLVQASPHVDQAVSREQPAPRRFDWHCPFMSLPLAFGTRLQTIPREVPYLAVPGEMRRKWRERLGELGPLRVGLSWAGSADNPNNASRSIRVAQLAELIGVQRARFVSLQKGPPADELRSASRPVADWMPECTDFLDTAALVSELDLVVSVCTATAHLAGALGKPVWLLLRHESEWRWLLDREDSVWYPTMKIFRQRQPGDWIEVVGRAARELASRSLKNPLNDARRDVS
jgi:tetratricopeptide (TPR) repeat protein